MQRQTSPLGVVFGLFIIVLAGPVSAHPTYELTVHELNQGLLKAPSLQQKAFFLIDVRSPAEHMTGFIPGTDRNIDFRIIARRHLEIGATLDDHIVVYCQSGRRSDIAADMLGELGYQYVYTVAGSMNAWNEAGYPVTTPGNAR